VPGYLGSAYCAMSLSRATCWWLVPNVKESETPSVIGLEGDSWIDQFNGLGADNK